MVFYMHIKEKKLFIIITIKRLTIKIKKIQLTKCYSCCSSHDPLITVKNKANVTKRDVYYMQMDAFRKLNKVKCFIS